MSREDSRYVLGFGIAELASSIKPRLRATGRPILRSLSKRIPFVRAEVVRAEAALQSYRIKHGFTETSRMDMVDQQLVDLNRQLAVAKSDLAELHGRPTPSSIDHTAVQSQLAAESSTLETRMQQLERSHEDSPRGFSQAWRPRFRSPFW